MPYKHPSTTGEIWNFPTSRTRPPPPHCVVARETLRHGRASGATPGVRTTPPRAHMPHKASMACRMALHRYGGEGKWHRLIRM